MSSTTEQTKMIIRTEDDLKTMIREIVKERGKEETKDLLCCPDLIGDISSHFVDVPEDTAEIWFDNTLDYVDSLEFDLVKIVHEPWGEVHTFVGWKSITKEAIEEAKARFFEDNKREDLHSMGLHKTEDDFYVIAFNHSYDLFLTWIDGCNEDLTDIFDNCNAKKIDVSLYDLSF